MPKANQKIQKAFQRKCPNCGASLKFDPSSGKLYCDHCKSLLDFEQSKDVVERDFSEMSDFTPWNEGEVAAYRCANCGASSVLPRTALATSCPFCHSPVVLDEKATGLVRPDSLVPFELSEKDAASQLSAWKKRKVYAPNKFRKHTRAKSLKGVFVPVWTFDGETTSSYSGRLGKHRTRTVRRNGKTYTETYTEWFHVSGDISASFDDVMIAGDNNIDGKYFNEVNRIDKSKYVVYSDEFLAGYIADNYTVGPQDAYKAARRQMDEIIRNKIIYRYGADVVGYLNVNTTMLSKSFKYMLFPVYVAATKFKGKLYNQYVAGFWSDVAKKKAHVSGTFPKSSLKIFFTVLAGLAALVGLFFLLRYAFQNVSWSDVLSGWEFDW